MRKRLVSVLLLSVVVLLAASCGGGVEAPRVPVPTSTTTATAEPVAKAFAVATFTAAPTITVGPRSNPTSTSTSIPTRTPTREPTPPPPAPRRTPTPSQTPRPTPALTATPAPTATPTQDPTPTAVPTETPEPERFAYFAERIPGSRNHSPDGTWWGYNQTKIARYGDIVFMFVVENDDDPATESSFVVYKKEGDGPWVPGARFPTSRPGNILVDSKGGLHAFVFDPFDVLANDSSGSLEHYYPTFPRSAG